jgi:molecular chaperone DnaK (HSP70)
MAIALGIDLGTTNTVVASVDVDAGDAKVVDVPIPQLIAPGETAALSSLASSVYLPAAGEFSEGDLRLPWGQSPAHPVGALARDKGARVPGRVIVSAKSWLSTSTVDRRAPILPWAAADESLPRLSPVEVQTRILEHVRHAVAGDIVDVTLTTHDCQGLSILDIKLARKLDGFAGGAAVIADHSEPIQCLCETRA